MIQPEMVPLTERLRALGMHITIETARDVVPAGGLRPDEHQPQAFQLNARGNFAEPHDRLRIQPTILAELMARYEYQLKFVVENPADLQEIRALMGDARCAAGARDSDAGGTEPGGCRAGAVARRNLQGRRVPLQSHACTSTCGAAAAGFEGHPVARATSSPTPSSCRRT